VVSDNPDASLSRRMSVAAVADLVARNVEPIAVFAGALAGLGRELAALTARIPRSRRR
jgi:hypothetical protein